MSEETASDVRTPAEASGPFWRWPSKWLKDETFWRDVFSGSFAVVIGGAFAAATAIVLGFLQVPKHVGALALIILIGYGVVVQAGIFAASLRPPRTPRKVITLIVLVPLILLSIFGLISEAITAFQAGMLS